MHMAIHKLSSRKEEIAGPGKYEDGGGLRLHVSAQGSKKWVFRYAIKGNRQEMDLGGLQGESLATARKKRANYRELVADGIDPIDVRDADSKKVPTFSDCASEFIDAQRPGWKNAKHAQ